eukprot:3394949-Alexandrium_andersonii.AAC.1
MARASARLCTTKMWRLNLRAAATRHAPSSHRPFRLMAFCHSAKVVGTSPASVTAVASGPTAQAAS